MPFARPTQEQIIARIIGDLEAEFPGADARLHATFERVAAKVVGKASHLHHAHLDWVSKQPFPDSATTENLDRLAYIFGLSDGQGGIGRKPANQAAGIVQVGGTSPGAISAGDVFTRPDGTRYTADDNTSWTGLFTIDIDVTAVEVGADGNSDAGTILSFETPHASLTTDNPVGPDGLTSGADRESDDNLRIRLLAKIRAPGSGGAPGDYIVWAQESTVNVTRAWELPRQLGANTMQVLIANDNLATKIPTPTTVTVTQDYMQKSEVATGGWLKITGVAPSVVPLTITAVSTKVLDYDATVTLEDGVAQTTAKEAIEAEVTAFLLRAGEPGETVTVNQILAAVMNAAGVKNASLTAPAADVTHTTTQIPIPGLFTPTWS